MTADTHVDGNALGGLFHDLFGREMTHHRACCDSCGSVRPVASLLVYRAAGDVVRCPNCFSVVIVIASSPTGARLGFKSLRWMEMEEPGM
ncbi:MAG TPA: DUF6510 family protein [Acidimicrobiia bacterium]|nr:DUF6510 family protein [Acidimicrobiia bacterium]